MKINGTRVTRERVEVEVHPIRMVEALRKALLTDPSFGAPSDAEYINADGVWESWIDTHGSGITTRHGRATPEQIQVMSALDLISKKVRKL